VNRWKPTFAQKHSRNNSRTRKF